MSFLRASARLRTASYTCALLLGPMAVSADAQEPPPAVVGTMVGPAVYVSDPARSARFYTEGLGMKVRMRFGPPDRPDQLVGYGADPKQPCIMLLSEKTGTTTPIQHGHGFDRIAFQVTGLAGLKDRLRKAGFAPGPIEVAHGSIQVMMLTDPDGYRIELIDTLPAPRTKSVQPDRKEP